MADLCSADDLLQLLLCGGSGAGSEKPSPANPPDPPPPPPSPLPMYYTGCSPSSGKETPSEAEMASWLCQVLQQQQQEPPGGAAATMNLQSEGGDAVVASGEAECRRGPSSSGRRRRSCSGKAAEQRRRNKINDKLRTLQQMTPSCSKVKTDTASTLEEVIKYVKSLQHQVQVMSANGYVVPTTPMMPPGVMPPPWTQLPRYPVFPAVYACPYHGTAPPHTRGGFGHPDPAEPGAGGRRQLAPRRHLVPKYLDHHADPQVN